MKNGNGILKEKAIKANELENISGGERVYPEKHPLDKSNSEAQSKKGINVSGGEQLSLDKLKDTSGGYNFSGYTYWVDKSICNNKCNNTGDCEVRNRCPAINISYIEGAGNYPLQRIEISSWICSHCGGCARECPYGAIKPYGR